MTAISFFSAICRGSPTPLSPDLIDAGQHFGASVDACLLVAVTGEAGPREAEVFDDTCYFLPFAEKREARVVAAILNSGVCQQFLTSLTFADSKRPITVELLERLNIRAIAEACGLAEDWRESRKCGVSCSEGPVSFQAEFTMERPAAKA